MTTDPAPGPWPELPSDRWADTIEALHLWTQIVGKVRMVNSPWLNHSWSVTLYVSATGLTTSLVPYGHEGMELSFDLLDHELRVHTTTGERRTLPLGDGTVADVYAGVMDALAAVGMPTSINPMPNEIADAVPFDQDNAHRSYVPEHATAWWRAMVRANRALSEFRAGFQGKASPVHFFWGSFDLATTRFSGRTAPPHAGGIPNFPDDVAREAYSHEVTSAGFWTGNRAAPEPIFYAYAYPTPDGYAEAAVGPPEAVWLAELGEFALPYSTLTDADRPDDLLAEFFASTHAAAAELAGWDRRALECSQPNGPRWWADRPHHP